MKRATLSAIPATAPASASGDLTDRLLNREQAPTNQVSGAEPPAAAKTAPKVARAGRVEPRPAKIRAASPETDSLGQALLAAQQAVEALQGAARSEPARYEVALRFRLDSLAHHVQQVKDYVAAALAR
jgi:hypothetical protein